MALFPRSLKSALERTTRPIAQKRGFNETRILTDWAQIVGVEIAGYAVPTKINFPRQQANSGTLTLSVHPAYVLEVQQMAPVLLEKIATHIGYRAIERISFEQQYLPLPAQAGPIHAANASIVSDASDPLEAALERLEKIRTSIR